MQPRRPDVYIELPLIARQKVPAFVGARPLSDYQPDLMCQSAIERQLEIAGDALGQLRKLDPTLFARISQGHKVVAFRNVLAHGYASVDHDDVTRSPPPTRPHCLRPSKGC